MVPAHPVQVLLHLPRHVHRQYRRNLYSCDLEVNLDFDLAKVTGSNIHQSKKSTNKLL